MANTLSRLVHHPDLGLLILRLTLGAVGVVHGSQKLFGAFGGHGLKGFADYLQSLNIPAPTAGAVLAALAEFGGGLLIALGIFPRLAALPFLATMLVAFFTAHGGKFSAGGEYPATLASLLLVLILTGPGRFVLHHLFFPPRQAKT